jgi:hypothetical protein
MTMKRLASMDDERREHDEEEEEEEEERKQKEPGEEQAEINSTQYTKEKASVCLR